MSNKDIKSLKEILDTNNKEERGLILAQKCERCGKVHPRLQFYWSICHDGHMGLRIRIICPDDIFLSKIFDVEKQLREIGFHFDTGYGAGRDWEFDWSLYGDHYEFDKTKKQYVKIESRSKTTRDKIENKP